MVDLKRDELNPLIETGNDIILYFYEPNHAHSTIGFAAVEEVENLVGRNFDVFIVNVLNEPEIKDAFGVTSVPETVSVKNKRIYKRSSGVLFSNQILDLIK